MIMTQKILDDNISLNEVKYVEFDFNQLEEYRNEFEQLCKKGVIVEDSTYDSSTWVIKTGVSLLSCNFTLTELEYKRIYKGGVIQLQQKELECALKNYAIIMLRKYTNTSVYQAIRTIINLAIESNGFSASFIPKIMTNKVFMANALRLDYPLQFIEYIGSEIDLEYADMMRLLKEQCLQEKLKHSNKRKLSLFSSAFMLDDYMQQAIKDLNDEEFEKFFPTVFWWKLSTIIPIRASELVATIKDCLRCENGENKLILSRSLLKGHERQSFNHSFEECYRLKEVKISSEIVDLIRKYNNIVDVYDQERKFLFSKKAAVKFWPTMLSLTLLEGNKDMFTYTNLRLNMDAFYDEILNEKYGLNVFEEKVNHELDEGEVQKFNIMDTRHFAIINMVLMGFEPVTIKELAGHTNINSSFHYFAHVEEFVQCYVISTAKRKALKSEMVERNLILNTAYASLEREHINKHTKKFRLSNKKYKVVDGGFCVYQENDYVPCYGVDGEHKRCKYFVPGINQVSKLVEELEVMDLELAAQAEILRTLVKNHKKTVEFSNKYIATVNNIRNKATNKAEVIANYLISNASEN